MPSYLQPARHLRPMVDRQSEPDSPHGSDIDMVMAQQTMFLAYRAIGTTRTWAWPYFPEYPLAANKSSCPVCEVAAYDTWTKFRIDGEDMGLPWRISEGMSRIAFFPSIVSSSGAPIKVRFDTAPLLDAMTTITGDIRGGSVVPGGTLDMMSWKQLNGAGGWQYGKVGSQGINTPSPPANRRMKLVPYLRVTRDTGIFDSGGKAIFYMDNLAIMDIADQELVGW